jgi:hypothetical protein
LICELDEPLEFERMSEGHLSLFVGRVDLFPRLRDEGDGMVPMDGGGLSAGHRIGAEDLRIRDAVGNAPVEECARAIELWVRVIGDRSLQEEIDELGGILLRRAVASRGALLREDLSRRLVVAADVAAERVQDRRLSGAGCAGEEDPAGRACRHRDRCLTFARGEWRRG